MGRQERVPNLRRERGGHAAGGQTLGGGAVLPAADGGFIKPGTLRLSWNGKTATDEAGRLKGAAAGYVDYYGGRAAVSDGLEAAAVEIAYQAYTGEAKEYSVGKQTTGALNLTLGRIAPGSLCLRVAYTARATVQTESWVQMKYNRLQAGQMVNGAQIVEAKNTICGWPTTKKKSTAHRKSPLPTTARAA
ncbi:Uncharacterised protein [Kingella potus]|uniref:Uncharacterized protein n=1 Tax=Kingella potus TaxID=265175 RepID=A0A377R0Y3_9NEIS|nr:hypothetical protein [Kingella potus]STR02397.1 Uncharacterised protein [Kingella potus]